MSTNNLPDPETGPIEEVIPPLPDPETGPIEEVLDEIIPDWKEQAKNYKELGYSDAEIVEKFQEQMREQMDSLLDLFGGLSK